MFKGEFMESLHIDERGVEEVEEETKLRQLEFWDRHSGLLKRAEALLKDI